LFFIRTKLRDTERLSREWRERVRAPAPREPFFLSHELTRLASPRLEHFSLRRKKPNASPLRMLRMRFSEIPGDSRRLSHWDRDRCRGRLRERPNAHALSSQTHALNLREESAKETKSKTKVHILKFISNIFVNYNRRFNGCKVC